MVNTPLAATPSQRSMGISMLVEEGGPTPSGDLETWVNVSKVAPLAYIPTVGPSPHPHYHRRLQETGSDAGGCLGTGFSPPCHLSTSSNSSGGVLGVGENHVQEVLVRVEARHLLAKAQASAAQHLEAQLWTALGSCQAAVGQLQEAGEWQQQEASLLAAYQELAGELCDRVTSMAQQLAQREAEILTLMDQVHKQAVQLSSKDGELASLTDQNSRLTHTLDAVERSRGGQR
ncbi:hypothetical protein HaLaN_08899 [Haematococcus lacustris]|uniref:Uncharacterized protein n=1 Tax=Haematococcus lacustris TaxID=44745 RepID=A0A699Z237_HAELA|nr:hypothetical protein HaLaN_08899 [Haematococcus lacustris]